MRHGLAMLLVAILTLGAGAGVAQMHGGSEHPRMGGQHMMGPDMNQNMGIMCNMMSDMQHMMGGRMPPEQHQQMMDMMNQMGRMMQEMGGPQGSQIQAQHQKQLQEMQQRLNAMKSQMPTQPPGAKPKQEEHKH